ncbi:hypothetical protein ABI59_04835 [Acidobacteria bacterium Mor1]|nr:hypothetical protein ABI59_04835 [Acidobacteria bacterium Mor1]
MFESFVVNMVIAAVNIGSGILLARLLGAEGRGELAAAQALPMILCMVGQLGLPQAVIYFGARDRERAGEYAVSATLLMLGFGVPLMALTAAITPWFLEQQRSEVVRLGQIYVLLLVPTAIHLLPVATSRALHRISIWNRLRLVSPVLWLVVVAALFLVDLDHPAAVLFIYLSLFFVAALIMIAAVRGLIGRPMKPAAGAWGKLLRYGLPLTLGAAPLALNQSLDRLIIAGMLPAAELGQYTVAISWTRIGLLPVTALTGVAFSKLAGIEQRSEQLRFIWRAGLGAVAVSALTVLVIAAATPWALPMAFGADFRAAIGISFVALISIFLQGIDHMLKVSMQGLGRTVPITIAEWSGLILLVPAAIWLIGRYGLFGAPWALVVGSGTVVLVLGLALLREARRGT